jgi:hypothetical protein
VSVPAPGPVVPVEAEPIDVSGLAGEPIPPVPGDVPEPVPAGPVPMPLPVP